MFWILYALGLFVRDAPLRRTIQRIGEVTAIPILRGLHYRYVRI